MFLSDAQIKKSLAGVLRQSVDDLDPDVWDQTISDAHQAAFREVRGILLARGFTDQQISDFDDGQFFERRLSLFFLASMGSIAEGYDLTAAKLMDCRKDIAACQVFIRGVWVKPETAPTGPGTVNTGGPKPDNCGRGGSSMVPSNPNEIRW